MRKCPQRQEYMPLSITMDMILTNCDYYQNIEIQSTLLRGLSSDHYITLQ